MKSRASNRTNLSLVGNPGVLNLALALLLLGAASAWAENGSQGNPRILPPQSNPFGRSYAEWSAAFWQWSLALPLEEHPFLDSPNDPYYDFTSAPSGKV